MLKGLGSGDVNGVIIHKIDRSARNLRDWADLGELIDAGVLVHFAKKVSTYIRGEADCRRTSRPWLQRTTCAIFVRKHARASTVASGKADAYLREA